MIGLEVTEAELQLKILSDRRAKCRESKLPRPPLTASLG